MKAAVLGLCLLAAAAGALAAPAPARKKTPRPVPQTLDFSGVWEIDASASENVSSAMKEAVLSVTQKGNRIWISPVYKTRGSRIMAEEIVADGRSYEKALGPAGKGTVTAGWAKDRQSLWIEVRAGEQGNVKSSAVQRSVWKLSSDRNVWVRESFSMSQGRAHTARLVFRRQSSEPESTPSPAPRQTPSH